MDLEEAINRISPMIGASLTSATRLAGLTNVNYRVSTPDEDVVIRIPGRGTSDYIDRHAEEVAALRTAEAGVNVPVRFFDVSDGFKPFIEATSEAVKPCKRPTLSSVSFCDNWSCETT